MWHIVQNSKSGLDNKVNSIDEYPYTISYLIRKRMQIDSWMELPKDKRPPEAIWDSPTDLEEWFDRVYDDKAQTEFNVNYNDDEVE